jgi:hypothetical protein
VPYFTKAPILPNLGRNLTIHEETVRMNLGTRGWSGLSAAVIMAIAAGCSSSGGGGATFSTSVPSSSQANTLTPAQTTQLCNDLNSFANKELKSLNFCQVVGVLQAASDAMSDSTLTDSDLQTECSQFVTLCNALFNTPDAGTTTSSCDPSMCTATVGQLTTCLNDQAVAAQKYSQMLPSCSMATRARLATVNPDAGPMDPASCTSLPAGCQDVSVGTSTDMTKS